MPLSFKDAVKKMHDDPKLRYHYFFCEKGQDNKPVVLVDTQKIALDKGDAKETLDTAKGASHGVGIMYVVDGTLVLKPGKSNISKIKLKGGLMVAVDRAQLQKFVQVVEIGEPDFESETRESESEQSPEPAGERELHLPSPAALFATSIQSLLRACEEFVTKRGNQVGEIRQECETLDEEIERESTQEMGELNARAKKLTEKLRELGVDDGVPQTDPTLEKLRNGKKKLLEDIATKHREIGQLKAELREHVAAFEELLRRIGAERASLRQMLPRMREKAQAEIRVWKQTALAKLSQETNELAKRQAMKELESHEKFLEEVVNKIGLRIETLSDADVFASQSVVIESLAIKHRE